MRRVNIHDAKTTLSQLMKAAEAGERVVLTRAGKPVVELVLLNKKRKIKLGVLKGRLPQKLLDDAAKSLSKAHGTTIEP